MLQWQGVDVMKLSERILYMHPNPIAPTAGDLESWGAAARMLEADLAKALADREALLQACGCVVTSFLVLGHLLDKEASVELCKRAVAQADPHYHHVKGMVGPDARAFCLTCKVPL